MSPLDHYFGIAGALSFGSVIGLFLFAAASRFVPRAYRAVRDVIRHIDGGLR